MPQSQNCAAAQAFMVVLDQEHNKHCSQAQTQQARHIHVHCTDEGNRMQDVQSVQPQAICPVIMFLNPWDALVTADKNLASTALRS